MGHAQDFSPQCQAIFNDVVAENPADFQDCEPDLASYTLETCEPPTMFNSTRPTSHLILAIDASGSMAGAISGETKLAVAQRKAVRFLADLPEKISVGLVVYGHEGDNSDTSRAVSCASSELVHGFDTDPTCLQELNDHALNGYSQNAYWLSDRTTALNDAAMRPSQEYRGSAGLDALQAAD